MKIGLKERKLATHIGINGLLALALNHVKQRVVSGSYRRWATEFEVLGNYLVGLVDNVCASETGLSVVILNLKL